MRFSINITREDLLKLHELEVITGIDKNSIMSILIDEVFASYKCSKISGDYDYMPMALATKDFKRNIKKQKPGYKLT